MSGVTGGGGDVPTWLQIVLGSGLVVVIVPDVTKRLNKWREARRVHKDAPLTKDAADIAGLRADVTALQVESTKVNTWLLGTKDPFTGELIGNGFKDQYPRDLSDLKRLIVANGNGTEKP